MIRDHLRKHQPERANRAVDGVLNAPVRSSLSRSIGGATPMQRGDIFRSTTSRSVDSFKRAEGFHAANQSQGSSRAQLGATQPVGQEGRKQPSILHMSLPGGSLSGGRKDTPRKKHGKLRTTRRWTLRTAAALSALVLLVGGFLFAKAYFSANQVFRGGGHAQALSCGTEVEPQQLKKEGDGRVNVLLLGLDDKASLTDSIMVASVDPVNKKSATVSIPRDLWVTGPTGASSKINAIYTLAKQSAMLNNPNKKAAEKKAIEALQSIVEKALGTDIHYYVTVDVAGFEQAVEIVGGVTVNVPEELAVSEHMWDDVRGEPYYLNVPAGRQKFDPQRALYFVRSRHTSPRGDFDRTERQRLFMQALAQQVLSAGTYTNPVRITQLMDAFSDNVATNLSVDDAWCLSKVAKEIGGNMESIGLADEPDPALTTGMVSNQSVVRPISGVSDFSSVHKLIDKKFVDGYIAREKSRVVVLNGTETAGRATQTAEELASYGYNVAKSGDAPNQNYEETILVSLHPDQNPYTQHYLEKRLDVSAVSKVPDSSINAENADFVIILGNR